MINSRKEGGNQRSKGQILDRRLVGPYRPMAGSQQDLTRAQNACQAKLPDITAGYRPLPGNAALGPLADFLCNERGASEPSARGRYSVPARLYIWQAPRRWWTVAATSMAYLLRRQHPIAEEPHHSCR